MSKPLLELTLLLALSASWHTATKPACCLHETWLGSPRLLTSNPTQSSPDSLRWCHQVHARCGWLIGFSIRLRKAARRTNHADRATSSHYQPSSPLQRTTLRQSTKRRPGRRPGYVLEP